MISIYLIDTKHMLLFLEKEWWVFFPLDFGFAVKWNLPITSTVFIYDKVAKMSGYVVEKYDFKTFKRVIPELRKLNETIQNSKLAYSISLNIYIQ